MIHLPDASYGYVPTPEPVENSFENLVSREGEAGERCGTADGGLAVQTVIAIEAVIDAMQAPESSDFKGHRMADPFFCGKRRERGATGDSLGHQYLRMSIDRSLRKSTLTIWPGATGGSLGHQWPTELRRLVRATHGKWTEKHSSINSVDQACCLLFR